MFSCEDLFDMAVQIEQNGERMLRNAQKQVTNLKLMSLLQRLADEEIEHAKMFSDLKPKVKQEIQYSELEDLGKSLLRDTLGDQSFSLKDTDFSKVENENELISIMIEFEKDTVLFYEMIRTVISDKAVQACLEKIIEAENQHAQKLQTFLASETEFS